MSFKGRKHTPETRAKIGLALVGRKGAPKGPETREKLRQVAIALWQDPEYRARHLVYLAAAGRSRVKKPPKEKRPVGRPPGTKQPADAIEKTRQATIRRWQDPEYRARHLPQLAEHARSPRRRVRPPKGTPEYGQYRQIVNILGFAAARSLQW